MKAITLTEAAIQTGISDLLKRFGFTVYHTRFSLGSDIGFPDVVALDDSGRIVAVECKGPKGRIRPGQTEWLTRFAAVPGCLFAGVVGPNPTPDWWGYDQALEHLKEILQG